MTTAPDPAARAVAGDAAWRLGQVSIGLLGVVLVSWALVIDYRLQVEGFFGDAATYYSLGHSLAEDFDFEFRREDLVRVWREFPTGPEGIFLKRGRTVHGLTWSRELPYIDLVTGPDTRTDRFYYGKAFIYPLVAAPLIVLFGTNGFFVLHALLMTACFACAYAFLVARSAPLPALVFATAFLLLLVVVVLNLTAIVVRQKLRRRLSAASW
jgi:hypothetical protein